MAEVSLFGIFFAWSLAPIDLPENWRGKLRNQGPELALGGI
jgi:hypothetical protein